MSNTMKLWHGIPISVFKGAATGVVLFTIAFFESSSVPFVLFPIAPPLVLFARYSTDPFVLAVGTSCYYAAVAFLFAWITSLKFNYSKIAGWILIIVVLIMHGLMYRAYLTDLHGNAVATVLNALSGSK